MFFTAHLSRIKRGSLRSLELCGEYFFMKTPLGVVVDCWELWVGQEDLLSCIGSDFSLAGDSLLVTIKTFRKITLTISLK